MDTLTANLSGRIQRRTLQGRDYVVAPMTLIVEGVLPGSDGPLFYPAEELTRNTQAWNGLPLVLEHPYKDGQPISARVPSVLDKQAVGIVLNAGVVDGKLKAEGWFDSKRLRNLNRQVYNQLLINQPIELSTGLFTSKVAPEGEAVWNGKPYKSVARNYRPDHVAILLGKQGACSVADGCGINVNSRTQESTMNEKQRKEVIDGLIANSCCWDAEDREELESLTDNQLTKVKEQADRDANREKLHNAAVKGFTDPGGNQHTWNEKTKAWETKVKKEKPEKKSEEENVTANEKKEPREIKEEDLPQTMREQLGFARTEMERQKTELIGELTANLKDEEKEKLTANLKEKSLDDLRALKVLAPKPDEDKAPTNYAGAAGGTQTVNRKVETIVGLPGEYL